MITIDPNGDLVVRVVEFDDSVFSEDGVVLQEEEFMVNKQLIYKHSRVLGMLLARHLSSEQASEIFTIKDDSTTSMEIWFRTMSDTLQEANYCVMIDETWNLAAATIKYELDGKLLYSWFQQYYSPIANIDPPYGFRMLVYPCWEFNHASGFIRATKVAVYRSKGHIMEANPTKHHHCHLPPRIIQQLNAAKGRMRTVLHRKTFAPIKWLQEATCECRYKTQFGYIGALIKTGVWPLDDMWPKMEVNEVLDHLKTFSYKPDQSACKKHCQRNYGNGIGKAISYIRGYFDGLCLDCIDKGNPKTWNHDTDYWSHDRLEKHQWDSGCRETHGEPTWYFSFMGRKEDRDHFCKDNDITLKAP